MAFVVAITVHEAAHAWMAVRLGDPTPKLTGRLSLNPLVHYDPIGTTLLFVLVILRALGAPVIPFGWAKPVMFDPYNLENPRRDAALISLAGPASNILLATILSMLIRIFALGSSPLGLLSALFVPIILLNIILAVFNLLPVHPLDGGKILVGILPERDALQVDLFLKRYGMLILIFLIFPTFGGASPVTMIISPVIDFLVNLLVPNFQFI